MCPSCSFCPPILLWAAKRHQIFACALLLQLSRLALRITQSGLPLTKETVDFLRRRSEVRRTVMTSALLSFSLRDLGPSIGTRYPHEYCDCDHQKSSRGKDTRRSCDLAFHSQGSATSIALVETIRLAQRAQGPLHPTSEVLLREVLIRSGCGRAPLSERTTFLCGLP